jgi:hypothetical protein
MQVMYELLMHEVLAPEGDNDQEQWAWIQLHVARVAAVRVDIIDCLMQQKAGR